MIVIEWEKFFNHGLHYHRELENPPLSMTVGVFDGVHRGHGELIKTLTRKRRDRRGAEDEKSVPTVITFKGSGKRGAGSEIQSFQERLESFERLGIEIVIVVDFTEEFSRMTGKEFLETVYVRTNIVFFAVGANFRCGCGLDTDAAAIKAFFAKRGVSVEIVPEVLHDGQPISSSRIRAALANGDAQLARELIG